MAPMVTLLFARLALASATYPAVLERDLGMPCDPPCTVCHRTNDGGAGTVVTAFGTMLQDRGLQGGGNYELLQELLAEIAADGVDSDDDATPDTDELAGGTDPNPGDARLCDGVVDPPVYGCFSHANVAPTGLLVVAGLAVARVRRRRSGSTSGS